MSDPNIGGMGLSEYSLTFGEAISKVGRHRLTLLCLESIVRDRREYQDNWDRGRGRPQSPATILATRIGVTYDTVRRWADFEKIQSCDANATKLARIAFEYDSEETIKILRQDVECHRLAIEDWVRQVDHQIGAGKLPPPLDKTQNIVAGAYDENTGIDKLNIASTNAVPRALCIQTQDNEKRVVHITA